ncbi:MAG: hypothetical protein ACLPV8_26385 [Steroidobacteraceae bacterium]
MSALPRVAESTREQVALEFDRLGPDACVAETSAHLRQFNPEWLDIATRCASDGENPGRIMGGFCMFYRLLIAQASPYPRVKTPGAHVALYPLPRVTVETRAAIVAEIDKSSTESFLKAAILQLEDGNPELLQMAHFFASAQDNDYLGTMQGFALLYSALLVQARADRLSVH